MSPLNIDLLCLPSLILLACIAFSTTAHAAEDGQSVSPEDSAVYYSELLFWRLGVDTDNDKPMSIDVFKQLLSKIGLEAMYEDHHHGGHDHGDHEGHDHGDHEGHDHGDHEGHDHGDHDGHDHGSDNHNEHEGHDHSDHRHRRAANNATDNETGDKCKSLDALLKEYYLDKESELYPYDFVHLCPALVDQLVNGACKAHDHGDHDHGDGEEEEDRNMALVWFYMFLCVTIISLCAVWGILCIPKKSRSVYQRVIQFLMALAAGSMAGDALLHLLPHAMMPPHDHSAHGHEGHDHGDEDGHDDHGDEHMDALLKGLMALLGLYAFFFLERFFSVYMSRAKGKSSDRNQEAARTQMLHNHSHAGIDDDIKFVVPPSSSNTTAFTDVTPSPTNGKTHHWPHPGNDLEAPEENNTSQSTICPTLTPLALMIVLGDMFHNFCDGLAIGAAFSSNTTIGLSTSIAVFCHELPHEIGDFAVLIKSGLSKKQAMSMNFLSALTCYLGAVVGMFLGNVGNAPMWIFAGVGGMFLYIALVDLVPEMTHVYVTAGSSWGVFLCLHAAGLFVGSALMLVLGIYEHDIQSAWA